MQITGFFIGLLTLIFVFHSVRVVLARHTTHTNLGDGDNDQLERRIRIHGNFAEYVPFLLIMLAVMEYESLVTPVWLWVFGYMVIFGRVLHAWGIWNAATPLLARVCGMAFTFLPLITGGVYLIYTMWW